LPTIGDWLTILNGSVPLTPERESIVRRKIWQKGNDHQRLRFDGTPCRKTPLFSDEFSRQNLLALLDLHERNLVNESIEKAEILRQLRRFDEASKILKMIPNEDQISIGFQIRKFADNLDSTVQLLERKNF